MVSYNWPCPRSFSITSTDDLTSQVLHAVFPTPASLDEYRSWYKNNALQRIQEKSWSLDGAKGIYIDIINDVINPTSVHWAADRLVSIPT